MLWPDFCPALHGTAHWLHMHVSKLAVFTRPPLCHADPLHAHTCAHLAASILLTALTLA